MPIEKTNNPENVSTHPFERIADFELLSPRLQAQLKRVPLEKTEKWMPAVLAKIEKKRQTQTETAAHIAPKEQAKITTDTKRELANKKKEITNKKDENQIAAAKKLNGQPVTRENSKIAAAIDGKITITSAQNERGVSTSDPNIEFNPKNSKRLASATNEALEDANLINQVREIFLGIRDNNFESISAEGLRGLFRAINSELKIDNDQLTPLTKRTLEAFAKKTEYNFGELKHLGFFGKHWKVVRDSENETRIKKFVAINKDKLLKTGEIKKKNLTWSGETIVG